MPTSTLRRACYQILYLNNFIYIEEYIIFTITITVLAAVQPLLYGIPAALVTFILGLLLFSPRLPSYSSMINSVW